MKLLRLIANLGYGSRKQVAAMFREGLITDLDGEVLYADDVIDASKVLVEDEPLDPPPGILLMLHKPVGYTCSHKDQGRLIYDLLPPRYHVRKPALSSVGRLDRDTSGLLLMTDDGALLHRLTSPKRRVAKVYEVTTRHPLTPAMLDALRDGVVLRDDPAPVRAEAAEATGECALRLTLTGGRYHQVRRMVAAAGNRVEALHRSGFGPLVLPADLARGQWRWVDPGALQDVASTTGAASAADSAGASGANRATEAVAAPR